MPPVAEFVIELARREGRLSESQIDAAEAHRTQQTDEFGEQPSLAETIATLGLLSETEQCGLLAAEFSLPVVRLDERRIDAETLSVLTREQAVRYGVMPLESRADGLIIAVSDPLDLSPVDELGHILGLSIDTVLATASEIVVAIDRHYGTDAAEIVVERPDNPTAEDTEANEDEPVIKRLHAIMAAAVRQRASDIHLEPLERRFRVRYRIDGRLREVEGPPKRLQLPLISRVKIMADLSIAEKRLPQDGRIQLKVEGKSIDLRVSTVPTTHGEGVVMRLLDAAGLKPDLGELGLEEADVATLRRLTELADGMVLVTGPTGSGKTTTLYSCLHEINRPERKIITVEDPVEYQLSGVNQVPVRSEVGLTFAAALRAMLRQAPNVVMVGEIRDRETADIAINASLTGHLVFSTLHTNDAPGAVTRLTDLGVKSFLVANSLRAVVAQRLVRRVCPSCRQEYQPSTAEALVLEEAGIDAGSTHLCRGQGCDECFGTGFYGRVALFEFFVVNDEIARMIHADVDQLTLRNHARDHGMRTLRQDGVRKAAAGVTTLEEVIGATIA